MGKAMRRLTLYVPRALEAQVRAASAADGVSSSAWLRDVVRARLNDRLPPPEVTRWFGRFPDFRLPTRKEPWSRQTSSDEE
jgi:hypothetical protein